MLAKYLELNSEGCITFQEKKTKAVVLRSRPQQNVKNAFSRRSRAVTAKKCTTKKRDPRAKLLFCQSKPIAFLPSSLLKLPI